MSPRGGARPGAGRRAVTQAHRIALRLTEDDYGWVIARGSPSDVVRGLIEAERLREGQMDVTDAQIEKLMTEAGEAGDMEQVDLCRRALDGDAAAREKCGRALAGALAMLDS